MTRTSDCCTLAISMITYLALFGLVSFLTLTHNIFNYIVCTKKLGYIYSFSFFFLKGKTLDFSDHIENKDSRKALKIELHCGVSS